MLLEAGKSAEALAAFEATLVKEPNRFNAYAGAAQAAERIGDAAKAKTHFGSLLDLAGDNKDGRPVPQSAALYMRR